VSLLLELLLKECIELVEPSSILRTIYLRIFFRTLSGLYAVAAIPPQYLKPKAFICFSDIHYQCHFFFPLDIQHQNNLYSYIFIIQHHDNLSVFGSQIFNKRIIR